MVVTQGLELKEENGESQSSASIAFSLLPGHDDVSCSALPGFPHHAGLNPLKPSATIILNSLQSFVRYFSNAKY
jgi:hypothetical protein